MTFRLPSDDQLAVTRGVAEFLAGNYPRERLRHRDGADTGRWRELAGIGALGISLPPAAGGMGMTWVDEALACREAGRQLLSPAFLGSVIALRLAARNGLEQLRDDLLCGARWAGIAAAAGSAHTNVLESGDGLALLVERHGVRLLSFTAMQASTLDCLDETIHLARLASVPTEVTAADDEELALGAQLLAAAMLCGVLEASLAMASGYARTRVQFGRPIGAFQAIKHRCADIALAAELCWSQTLQAAAALSALSRDAGFHVLAAALLAGEETLKAARATIQIHGGMGFTDEVDAHRLLKRAHVLHQLFGDPRLLPALLIDLPLEL
jgi:alkylation response protein AidB-like acyl-CoA dehydrogenase